MFLHGVRDLLDVGLRLRLPFHKFLLPGELLLLLSHLLRLELQTLEVALVLVVLRRDVVLHEA